MTFLLFALLTSQLPGQPDTTRELSIYKKNKQIPHAIERQVLTALSHYPELEETTIRFVFTRRLKRSVMAARPVVASLLKGKDKRAYSILINPVFKLKHHIDPLRQIPDSVLIGWIGHELGHIMDYERRSAWDMAVFGISYGLSKKYIRKAERTADTFATNHGIGPHLVATKNFILDHTELPARYRDKIAELYLSPDDIMELVTELEKEEGYEAAETLEEEAGLAKEIDGENT
ncbi:hypothetical protein [Parapedobacter lycopersici]|uniref:hypothetical protein n=1 Tax=Parapedobacter lycopersici TaxID=1864939 RepID=UPI003340824E